MYLHEAITENRHGSFGGGPFFRKLFSWTIRIPFIFLDKFFKNFWRDRRSPKCSCRLLVSVINMVIHLPQTLQLSLQLANMNSEFLSQSPLCCHVVHLESSSLQPICSHKSKNTETFVYFTIRFNSLLRL